MTTRHILFSLSAALLLSACSSGYEKTQPADDPLEPVNRAIFAANDAVDSVVFKPLAQAYSYVPKAIRLPVRNVLSNLNEPFSLANNVLQGDVDGAQANASRFLVNSTVGIAGIMDIATQEGIQADEEDIGQTLAVWGVGEGAYFVAPIFGPSNLRDFPSRIAGFWLDPVDYVIDNDGIQIGMAVTRVIDGREQLLVPLENLKEQSIDYYAAVKSLAEQRRANEIAR